MHGIPELQVPSLDPMQIDSVRFNTGNGSSMSLEMLFTNLTLYGCTEVELRNMQIDVEAGTAQIDTYFPRTRAIAHYHMHGRFLIMQIDGSGQAEGNYSKLIIALFTVACKTEN